MDGVVFRRRMISSAANGLAMRHIVFTLITLTGIACSMPARSEQQLPLDEQFPCEVVLHELIAELRALRLDAVHEIRASHKEDVNERAEGSTATVQALDKVIEIAARKMTRCPWVQ